MIDIKLDPCRYCGGEAMLVVSQLSTNEERHVIECRRCGITLDHTQYWYTRRVPHPHIPGEFIDERVASPALSAIEIWNGGMLNGKM